uniref:U4/U6 small nuclear ribonucleoprotein Prp31 n=1 Tax=Eptatretus burgeri TaxID=7764 RepID=A0A8C4NGE1_EPTBU
MIFAFQLLSKIYSFVLFFILFYFIFVSKTSDIIHKFVRDKYSKRFPELESLVPGALEYIRTVKELGNQLERCKSSEVLQQVLTHATIMVVSVTASTTQGSLLTPEELDSLGEACTMGLELSEARLRILDFVESRMSLIAPNLSIIVGASTAAKLMGVAGGLTPLSKMPACNVHLLGAQRRTLAGFSSTAILPHTGFIFYSPIVQALPPDLRRKAARLIAAKCTLAARVDSFHESTDGKVFVAQLFVYLLLVNVPMASTPLSCLTWARVGRSTPRLGWGTDGVTGAISAWMGGELLMLGVRRGEWQTLRPASGVSGPHQLQRTLAPESSSASLLHAATCPSTSTPSSVPFGLEIVNPQAAERRGVDANKYFSARAEFLRVKKDHNTQKV